MSENEIREEGDDFIRALIKADLAEGKNDGRVHTRFPPEPNGYLHIGHAKSICLQFALADEFNGTCNLRFDDTNPAKEETEFVESIQEDIRWLGFDWGENLFFASDYYEQLYGYAEQLIEKGLAYVCSLTADQVREYRGTTTEPGTPSPDRDATVEKNLDLFRRMKAGEFEDGEYTLRAKIDMASPYFIMRDPPLYRIRHAHHHRTGDAWCIYPMYDFAHCIGDALENITHSICTLEFENNRRIYDWVLDHIDLDKLKTDKQPKGVERPYQYEFARLKLSHTVMSKRKLRALVEEGKVSGWNDPRMPTVSGMRRRGYTPKSIRDFCEGVGVAKRNALVEISKLEYAIRKDLEDNAERRMAVLDPLKVVITNYPEDGEDIFTFPNHPKDESMGTREVPFAREVYIERADFMEDPPKKFFRLGPGREVRLRHAYLITCDEVTKDDAGNVIELRCSYDPESKGGNAPDGRKVKGTMHWVSARHAVPAEVRLYESLFTEAEPDAVDDFHTVLNPDSLKTVEAFVEPSLKAAKAGERFQFERTGYFCVDPDTGDSPVFNRTVSLKDSWAKMQKKK
jgi:glutaminyl-tRNA synthetase